MNMNENAECKDESEVVPAREKALREGWVQSTGGATNSDAALSDQLAKRDADRKAGIEAATPDDDLPKVNSDPTI